jgi:hypothetical protein
VSALGEFLKHALRDENKGLSGGMNGKYSVNPRNWSAGFILQWQAEACAPILSRVHRIFTMNGLGQISGNPLLEEVTKDKHQSEQHDDQEPGCLLSFPGAREQCSHVRLRFSRIGHMIRSQH